MKLLGDKSPMFWLESMESTTSLSLKGRKQKLKAKLESNFTVFLFLALKPGNFNALDYELHHLTSGFLGAC
jgi:hypothetical protein